jgi:serine/threonine protein kinase
MHQMIDCVTAGVRRKRVFKFAGDPEWMAPEVLAQATTFDEKVDIYSLGITALEMMYGKTPFEGWPALKVYCWWCTDYCVDFVEQIAV